MQKTRTLIGLTALMCALALTTTPANAFFESNLTLAPVASFPTVLRFEQIQEGVKLGVVKCEKTATTKATGFWTIQTSEQTVVTVGTKEQKQPSTKVGPHEAILIHKWGSCIITLGGTAIEARLSECRLGLAQPGKSSVEQEASVGFQTDCRIFIPGVLCTLRIEQTAANLNLVEGILKNGANGVLVKGNVRGITTLAEGAGCNASGLASTTEDTFKTGEVGGGEAIETAGQKLI